MPLSHFYEAAAVVFAELQFSYERFGVCECVGVSASRYLCL
jgi:hypothetical protein